MYLEEAEEETTRCFKGEKIFVHVARVERIEWLVSIAASQNSKLSLKASLGIINRNQLISLSPQTVSPIDCSPVPDCAGNESTLAEN